MERKKITKLGAAILNKTSGMRQIDLANSLEISKTHLNHIINGNRRLTVKVAKRLGEITDSPARQWIEIQLDEELG